MSKVKLCISLELPMYEFRTGHFILRTDVYSYLCCMYQLNIRFMIIFYRFSLFSTFRRIELYLYRPAVFYNSQGPFPSKQNTLKNANAFEKLFQRLFIFGTTSDETLFRTQLITLPVCQETGFQNKNLTSNTSFFKRVPILYDFFSYFSPKIERYNNVLLCYEDFGKVWFYGFSVKPIETCVTEIPATE